MVVVGGITRLTESGLSITEWKPLSGAIPPLNARRLAAELRALPGDPRISADQRPRGNGPRRVQNSSISGNGFTACSAGWSGWRSRFRWPGSRSAAPSRAAMAGGWSPCSRSARVQGALGWYMVQSGLVDRTDVSHFRLSAHLLTALFLLAGLVWTALDLRQLARDPASRPARLTALSIACRADPVDPIAARRMGRRASTPAMSPATGR